MDDQGRLIGRVTIADVVDVMREDSQEQALSRAGLQEEDISPRVHRAAQPRALAAVHLCTAATASFVASQFEGTVSQIVILAFLMSIVAGIGGNSGNQTMTLIIRALAMGRITGRNLWQLVKRELFVTLMVGLCGSLVAALFAWAIAFHRHRPGDDGRNDLQHAGRRLGRRAGAHGARALRQGSAMGSSVLLTFATDSLGFFIFLGLATLFLL